MSALTIVLPHFEPYSPISGLALATIAAEVTAELQKRGATVTVVAPKDGEPTYAAGRALLHPRGVGVGPPVVDRVLTRLLGQNRSVELGYNRRVRRSFEGDATPSNVVVINDVELAANIAHSAPHSRVFVWLQNELSPPMPGRGREISRLTGVLAVSAFIAQRWTEVAGPTPPVRVVPNGVNVHAFRPAEPAPNGTIRSCFVGRVDPNKGPLEAARAVTRAQIRGVDISFDLAGPVIAWGCDEEMLRRYLTELGEAVAACGGSQVGRVARDDLPAFYAAHDVAFVLSISDEPFGLVALEAMAGGCAVVASDRGGLPDTCGGAALLVDPEDPNAVDRAIDALEDRAVLAQLRQDGRAFAETRSWSRTVDQLIRWLDGPEAVQRQPPA